MPYTNMWQISQYRINQIGSILDGRRANQKARIRSVRTAAELVGRVIAPANDFVEIQRCTLQERNTGRRLRLAENSVGYFSGDVG